MVALTITTTLQLIAALTIPAIIGFIALTQMSAKAKFQWKQGRIALILSLVPLILVLSLHGILTTLTTLLSLGALLVVILVVNPDQN